MPEKITVVMLHQILNAGHDIIELVGGLNAADTISKLKHIIENPNIAARLQSRCNLLDIYLKQLGRCEIGGGS